jgi:hypothetical protein
MKYTVHSQCTDRIGKSQTLFFHINKLATAFLAWLLDHTYGDLKLEYLGWL